MGGDHDGHADLVEGQKHIEQLARVLHIEIGGWLIRQQNRRAMHHSACNRQPLLLAARERDRIGFFARQQTHFVERGAHALGGIRRAKTGDRQG